MKEKQEMFAEIKSEFILDEVQYQKVYNVSWNVPLVGYRRREVDHVGRGVSDWENIHSNVYNVAYKLYINLKGEMNDE